MSNAVSITCEGVNGPTLDKMNDIIAQRARVLGETTKDAVIASAINVLVSLRSSTRDAKKSKVKFDLKVEEESGLFASFSPSLRKHVIRVGHARRGAHWQPPSGRRVRWYTFGLRGPFRVFHVSPSMKYLDYYAVAKSAADVIAAFRKMEDRNVRAFGTLAKFATVVAMNALSTKSQNEQVSDKARKRASTLSKTNVYDRCTGFGEGEFGVEVLDTLDYAVDALKGGASDIELAFQKAANKTAGLMKRYMADHGSRFFSNETVTTPFPEVMQKRRSA